MIYLSGCIRPKLYHPMLGFIRTPNIGNQNTPSDAIWAADNGRFTSPQTYTDDGYLAWLAKQRRETCLFATAPDVLANHAATVDMSLPLFPRLRRLGYLAAFVAQDGWREDNTPWSEFDVLFVGGTTVFKLGAGGESIAAARRRGKPVHMGRVNSYQRLRVAAALGCASADGTFIKFAPDQNEVRMLRWLEQLMASPILAMNPVANPTAPGV